MKIRMQTSFIIQTILNIQTEENPCWIRLMVHSLQHSVLYSGLPPKIKEVPSKSNQWGWNSKSPPTVASKHLDVIPWVSKKKSEEDLYPSKCIGVNSNFDQHSTSLCQVSVKQEKIAIFYRHLKFSHVENLNTNISHKIIYFILISPSIRKINPDDTSPDLARAVLPFYPQPQLRKI